MKDYNWQFVSLELSKKLKSAGYKQEGLWWWDAKDKKIVPHGYFSLTIRMAPNRYLVAPTVAELGEALPQEIWKDKEFWELHITKRQDKGVYYLVRYVKRGMEALSCNLCCDKSEANARARMWIYLRKKGLL